VANPVSELPNYHIFRQSLIFPRGPRDNEQGGKPLLQLILDILKITRLPYFSKNLLNLNHQLFNLKKLNPKIRIIKVAYKRCQEGPTLKCILWYLILFLELFTSLGKEKKKIKKRKRGPINDLCKLH
jgi:hypothetical protein